MVNGVSHINLRDGSVLNKTFEVVLDDKYFVSMQGIINGGHVEAVATCTKVNGNSFYFQIHSEGGVFTPCDRCLDNVELRIHTDNELVVELGSDDDDEGDVVMVSENHPILDVRQLVYQFVVLSLPIRRVHEPGMCNEAMMESLLQHQVARSDDGADDILDQPSSRDHQEETDSRWDKLKSLLNK